ncbi:hypothetical protein LTR95_009613 [Oleoguttula sp. CCFEE 5521]
MGSLDNPIAKSTTEAKVFERFDELHARGELLWEPNEPIHIPQHPFDAYIRVSPALVTKPYNPGDTSRKPAFTDDPPEYTLCEVGPAHKLILNKYCWVRPQLILHTLEYESQREGLTLRDVDATWQVLRMLGPSYMAIFNGGPEAGGSIAHKHVQIMPKPGWKMFPESCLTQDPEMAFLPRTQAGVDGCAAGAQAMLGDIWTKTNEQVQQWQVLQPMSVLAKLGVQV